MSTNTGFDQKHWVISDDPTVVPEEHRDMPFFTPNTKPKELSGKNKRLVFAMDKFMVSTSRALLETRIPLVEMFYLLYREVGY